MIEFNFKVGDKVRLDRWVDHSHVTITAVGEAAFLAMGGGGSEYSWRKDANWLPYVAPPVRRKWLIETEERPYRRGLQFVAGNIVVTASGWDDHDRIINQIVGEVVEVTE